MGAGEKYKNVFVSVFNISEEELNTDIEFGSIKSWSSISHLSLITALEDEFDIMFDSEDILDFLSYETGKKIIAKYDIII